MDDIFDFLDSDTTTEKNKNEKKEPDPETKEEEISTKKEKKNIEVKKEVKIENTASSTAVIENVPCIKLQKNLHPISLVDFIEKNFPVFFSLNKKRRLFELTQYKNTKNIKYSLLEKMSIDSLKKRFQNNQFKNIVSAGKDIIIGESTGTINVFNSESGLSSARLNLSESTQVTCMDITHKGDVVVAGYENGYIAIWNIQNSEKPVLILKDKHCSSVIAIKIAYFESLTKFILVSSDEEGNVLEIKVEKGLFGMKKVKCVKIYSEDIPTILIETVQLEVPNDKSFEVIIAALGTCDSIKLYVIEPSISIIQEIKRFSDSSIDT